MLTAMELLILSIVIRYQWKLNNIESGLLKVVPQSGTIMPNEIQVWINSLIFTSILLP
jgi:hypothetical protein